MRLDKFLKVSRIIKRRTVANEVSDNGRVYVNGNSAKPAKQLKVGDIISIEYKNMLEVFIADYIENVLSEDITLDGFKVFDKSILDA